MHFADHKKVNLSMPWKSRRKVVVFGRISLNLYLWSEINQGFTLVIGRTSFFGRIFGFLMLLYRLYVPKAIRHQQEKEWSGS